MYRTTIAKVVWILVPFLSLGIASPVAFVVAASKGVISGWVPMVYTAVTVALYLFAVALEGVAPDEFFGLLILLLIIVAATHTALIDNDHIQIGK